MITADELKDFRYLPMEIQQIDNAVYELKTYPPLSMSPGQKREYTHSVVELIGSYVDRKKNCIAQLEKLMAFMNDIEDSFIFDLFQLRYEQGEDWKMIDRMYCYADGTTRQICRRYLERCN